MTVITKTHGAVKLSEVAVDEAFEVYDIAANDDAHTLVERMRRVLFDSMRKKSVILSSTGLVQWNGPLSTIVMNSGVSLNALLIRNVDEATTDYVNLTFAAAGPNTTWTISNGHIIYIELYRSLLNSSNSITLTDGINAAGTPGRRILRGMASALPKFQDSDDGESILIIPLVVREDTSEFPAIWWTPNGLMWPNEFDGVLGTLAVSPSVPLGTVVPYWSPLSFPAGIPQSHIDTVAPGWQLCDGGLINNPSSPFNGFYIPNLNGNPNDPSNFNKITANLTTTLGSPLVTVNSPAIDNFYVGQEISWAGVFAAGTTVIAVTELSGPNVTQTIRLSSNAISATTGNATLSNHTFLRGSTTSSGLSGNFTEKNSHQLSGTELPSHDHGSTTSSAGSHAHSPGPGGDTPQGTHGLLHPPGTLTAAPGGTGGFAGLSWKASGGVLNYADVGANSDWTGHNHDNLSGGLGAKSGGTPYAQVHNNMPQYFDVVYIMRVI
jgi:hypothetical protein